MRKKTIIEPKRLRQIPSQFSWLDHRLVRHKHICCLSPQSISLYLFLVTVGDIHGLSYYRNESICEHLLKMSLLELEQARNTLLKQSLVAYDAPFYQVLDLHPRNFIAAKEVQS